MKNIAKAIISVMKDVKGMEKNSRVGKGRSAYDGTKDQDVKEVFNEALAKQGLCMMPIEYYNEEIRLDRWEEPDPYNKGAMKTRTSILTTITAKYLLLHESGESQIIAGYGHGIDPADKGAGKATTYAMKGALIYTFMTPVGKIDDTDRTHSNNIKHPPAEPKEQKSKALPAKASPAKEKKEKEDVVKTDKEITTEKVQMCIGLVSGSDSIDTLKKNWKKIKAPYNKNKSVIKAKDEAKEKLT